MLSTRMIIDHRMLSMNSSRAALCAALVAFAVAAIGMSVMPNSPIIAIRLRFLKPRNVRKCELACVDMHTAELGAAMQRREHFSRVEQALRIERAFQPLLLIEIDL